VRSHIHTHTQTHGWSVRLRLFWDGAKTRALPVFMLCCDVVNIILSRVYKDGDGVPTSAVLTLALMRMVAGFISQCLP